MKHILPLSSATHHSEVRPSPQQKASSSSLGHWHHDAQNVAKPLAEVGHVRETRVVTISSIQPQDAERQAERIQSRSARLDAQHEPDQEKSYINIVGKLVAWEGRIEFSPKLDSDPNQR